MDKEVSPNALKQVHRATVVGASVDINELLPPEPSVVSETPGEASGEAVPHPAIFEIQDHLRQQVNSMLDFVTRCLDMAVKEHLPDEPSGGPLCLVEAARIASEKVSDTFFEALRFASNTNNVQESESGEDAYGVVKGIVTNSAFLELVRGGQNVWAEFLMAAMLVSSTERFKGDLIERIHADFLAVTAELEKEKLVLK